MSKMINCFKRLLATLSLVSLSLYCHAILAVEGAGAVTPIAPLKLVREGRELTQQEQLLTNAMRKPGAMIFMLGGLWLLINLVRKLSGGKPNFKRPLVMMALAGIMIYMGPSLVT